MLTTKKKSENKKISVNKIDKILSANKVPNSSICYEGEEEKVEILINNKITLEDEVNFVTEAVKIVFQEDEDGSIKYCPFYEDFAFRVMIISHFTNFTLSSSAKKLHGLVFSELYSEVCEYIDGEQLSRLRESYTKYIEYKKNDLLETNSKQLSEILSRIESVFSLFENFKDIGNNISQESIVSAVEKINAIDDETIINSL